MFIVEYMSERRLHRETFSESEKACIFAAGVAFYMGVYARVMHVTEHLSVVLKDFMPSRSVPFGR